MTRLTLEFKSDRPPRSRLKIRRDRQNKSHLVSSAQSVDCRHHLTKEEFLENLKYAQSVCRQKFWQGVILMVMRRFVEAAGRKTDAGYRGEDRIRGTNKVRTYVTGAWLYSKESDLDKIIRKRRETIGIRKKDKRM